MINVAELIAGDENKKRNYAGKQNTAALIQRVVSCLQIEGLTGGDLWDLVSLTWITKNRDGISAGWWRKYKVPALLRLFGKEQQKATNKTDLTTSIMLMGLPDAVKEVAIRNTGFNNFYTARRNSTRVWCDDNAASLRAIFRESARLGSDNQTRFQLAQTIQGLPGIPLPNGTKPTPAFGLITPFVACLDPLCRFPIVNRMSGVNDLLKSMNLASSDLETEVRGLIGLIDRFSISDAFMIDVCAEELAGAAKHVPRLSPQTATTAEGTPLEEYDESERLAVQKSGTVEYRNRHNKITNALQRLFATLKPEQGRFANNRFDALLRNYDGAGRDLLIEVKPDPDKGSLRIAIGQLYDYRRFLNNSVATDLAVLTICKPEERYLELLLVDRGITTLWFEDESCSSLKGAGNAWKPLAAALQNSHSKAAVASK